MLKNLTYLYNKIKIYINIIIVIRHKQKKRDNIMINVATKTGGGNLKDSGSVHQVINICYHLAEVENKNNILVVSAFNKTTNLLEKIVKSYIEGSKEESYKILDEIKIFHLGISETLFPDDFTFRYKLDNLFHKILFEELPDLKGKDLKYILDHILPFGELISAMIIENALKKFLPNIPSKFIDARYLISTDNSYGEANVDFEKSCNQSKIEIKEAFEKGTKIILTQGFVGRGLKGATTTLGREGSDYTASLLSFFLNVNELRIFKNVRGIYTCDPNGPNGSSAVFIPRISRSELKKKQESGEIVHVLHPRTLEPLEMGNILCSIRSFYNPEEPGTVIY